MYIYLCTTKIIISTSVFVGEKHEISFEPKSSNFSCSLWVAN